MEGVARPLEFWVTCNAGTIACRSLIERTPCWSRARWVWAETLRGTWLMLSLWRVAVTTTASNC